MATPENATPENVGLENVSLESASAENASPESVGAENVSPENGGAENVGLESVTTVDADLERHDEMLQPAAGDPSTATDAGRIYLARLAAWETEGGRVADYQEPPDLPTL